MDIRVGTSGFAYPHWRGRFYPEDVRDDAMLAYYASRLPTVEINHTFYRTPTSAVVTRWREHAGTGGFTFVWKASRRITHQAKLRPPEAYESMAYLYKVAAGLGDHLGPVLIQTPPYLGKDTGLLREFLSATVPPGRAVAFELQGASWDADDVDQVLADHGCARCIADRDDGSARVVRTAPWTYLRLRKEDYSDRELAAWLDRMLAAGGERAWIFFKHEDTVRGVEMALALHALAGMPAATPGHA